MNKLPLGLFIGYLIFISLKSFKLPTTTQETCILLILGAYVVSTYLVRYLHRKNYQSYLISKQQLKLQEPEEIPEEIKKLEYEAQVEALKLKKFITNQEFSKREIARTVENSGGMRF